MPRSRRAPPLAVAAILVSGVPRRRVLWPGLLIFAVMAGCSGGHGDVDDAFLLGGIQINEPDMDRWHRTLRAEGFDTVALTVYARQQAWNGAELVFEPPDPDGDLVREMRAAERRGLRTALVLRVALEHGLPENRFLWHGMIQPADEKTLDAWFRRYAEFVRGWARIAEAEGVDLLGIGSELSSLTSTLPVTALPGLEEYYLNVEKQARERRREALARRAPGAPEVAPRHLDAGWGDEAPDLETFLDERSRAHARWARAVTGGADIAWINRRRERLDRGWRRIVEEARDAYRGRLTYAANFDQYRDVGFWDALDVMGVNAYFPLRRSLDDGPVTELEPRFREAWRSILSEIDQTRRRVGRPDLPVVFTELGYTRRRGCTIEPWAGGGVSVVGKVDLEGRAVPGREPRLVVWAEQPLEPEERAAAVRALDAARRDLGLDLLRGLLWWKLTTVPEQVQIEPFALVLGERTGDPLLPALRALAEPVR